MGSRTKSEDLSAAVNQGINPGTPTQAWQAFGGSLATRHLLPQSQSSPKDYPVSRHRARAHIHTVQRVQCACPAEVDYRRVNGHLQHEYAEVLILDLQVLQRAHRRTCAWRLPPPSQDLGLVFPPLLRPCLITTPIVEVLAYRPGTQTTDSGLSTYLITPLWRRHGQLGP